MNEKKTAIQEIESLFAGYGFSDAYGAETCILHESEIEKLARENRRATKSSCEQSWPSDEDARSAFVPIVQYAESLKYFRERYDYIQNNLHFGIATKKASHIIPTMRAILAACDDAEFGE